jgi:NAD(P)-dependent dehydrogenase (short-subunit alcohol dehydrogenase family)
MNANDGNEGRGRLAVVIGGASGIGAETARVLHRRGWRIAIADIEMVPAQEVAAACGGFATQVDVLDAESIRAAARAIEGYCGPVHGLVNSAALFQKLEPPESYPLAYWDRIVAANHRGTYVSIVTFAAAMARTGGGAIVNISSMSGLTPSASHAYASSKAAVNSLTVSMAAEWGKSGVRVNAVSPGFVAVPRMLENIRQDGRYVVSPVAVSALGRLVEPEEVAEPIAFLLSDRASGITCANLVIDAGVLAAQGWTVHGGVPPARAPG